MVKLFGSNQPNLAFLTDDEELEVWFMAVADTPDPLSVTMLLQSKTPARSEEVEEPPKKKSRQQWKTHQNPCLHTHLGHLVPNAEGMVKLFTP